MPNYRPAAGFEVAVGALTRAIGLRRQSIVRTHAYITMAFYFFGIADLRSIALVSAPTGTKKGPCGPFVGGL